MKTVETHGEVGMDDDDLTFLPKLADNVGISLAISYVNELGGASVRVIEIDGVFGFSLNAPQVVVAWDSLSGERRKFRLDRVTAILDEAGRPIRTEHIPWLVGGMVRDKADGDLARPPLEAKFRVPVIVRDEVDGIERDVSGFTETFTLRYTADDVVAVLTARLGAAGEATRLVRYVLEPPRDFGRRLISLACGETGEEIDDIYAWAAEAVGLSSDGLRR